MEVDGRLPYFEDRIGYGTVFGFAAKRRGQLLGIGFELFLARQVYPVDFEAVVAVRFDEIERFRPLG